VIPIVTPDEMRAIDLAAPEGLKVLVERAGREVARVALSMLGGSYGRRVAIICGKGNNGADGRIAAAVLEARGIRVEIFTPDVVWPGDRSFDLVIDAAFGTGFRDSYDAPRVPRGIPVLAVDIPSGVDGLTGVANGSPLEATSTVTFGALKPGLLLADGKRLSGDLFVSVLGLDVSRANAWLVEAADVVRWVPHRDQAAHKWKASVWVAAGSPGMQGAARLVAAAAQRAGAGMVRLGSPGCAPDPFAPTEVITRALPAEGWAADVLADLKRFQAMIVGPGLGRLNAAVGGVRQLVNAARLPIVIDADGLLAVSVGDGGAAELLKSRVHPTVLTPHDAEFSMLFGEMPGADRMTSCRYLAARTGSIVLLKGPTTIIAAPDGRHYVVTEGDERLATAGTGDVLAGIIGGLLARGVPAFEAAAAAAFLNGRAAKLGHPDGLVASDLIDLLPAAFDSLR
jgi:hydroxyethylthiazole kinase-like uncharacterized protein yjeF